MRMKRTTQNVLELMENVERVLYPLINRTKDNKPVTSALNYIQQQLSLVCNILLSDKTPEDYSWRNRAEGKGFIWVKLSPELIRELRPDWGVIESAKWVSENRDLIETSIKQKLYELLPEKYEYSNSNTDNKPTDV